MWRVMFKGRELVEGRDYTLEVDGPKIDLQLLNLHLNPGSKVDCVVDTQAKIIHVNGKTSTVQAMLNSMDEVDENRRICLDVNDLEEL